MLQLNWANATEQAVGWRHGLTPADLDAVGPRVEQAHQVVLEQCRQGKLGYWRLPTREDYKASVLRLVGKHKGRTSDLVVLGIGGSALGNIALHNALKPATYNLLDDRRRKGPRLFVLDNVDPALVAGTLSLLGGRLKTTLVNVISKSGETAETAAQFMVVRELLRRKLGKGFAERIVATTDLQKGTLHDIALQDGYDMLEVPGDVGGRFSVLSPVGLFSAAMCGINIGRLLGGAAAMAGRIEAPGPWRANPACVLAAVKYVMMTAKGKPIHVMMPYSNRLYSLADWYRQLWAESLGKARNRAGQEVFVGPTPVKALGATDQHSQVQLYREGPNDKLMVFLEAAKHPADVTIPKAFQDVGGLGYLGGHKLSELLAAEKTATEYALARSRRPSVSIRFDAIDAASVGAFILFYEYVTSLMGELLDINAYDQPAVELGKQATFALLGRPGEYTEAGITRKYEELAAEIRQFAQPDPQYVL